MSLKRQRGVTLIELLVTATISVFVVAGLSGVIRATLESKSTLEARLDLTRQAAFAMERIARMVAHSPMLLLPMPDKPASNWPEDIREETIPPSPPIGSSDKATAVLSVLLPHDVDLDFDGFPDADNDRDGSIDEDLYRDMNRDGVAGVKGIDDDGDGYYDNVNWWDDDEEGGGGDEDSIDGIDDDGDGLVDEDSPGDMNGDGAPGMVGVDDDGDGQIDEGDPLDDDEDGNEDEDWFDTVTYFLQGDLLMERMPVPWDTTGNSTVTGWDFVESPIAEGLTRLRFQRIVQNGTPLVDVTIELTGDDGQMVSLNRRVRVGGAL